MDNQGCVENGSTTVIDTTKHKQQQEQKLAKNDDYIPSHDNLIDDERTIEEEENLSEDSSNSREIEKLKQESEIPIEKLLMMYKCGGGGDDGLNENNNRKDLLLNDSTDDYDYEDDEEEDDDDFDDDFDDDDEGEDEDEDDNQENKVTNNDANNNKNNGLMSDENNQQLKNSKKQKTNDLETLINNSNSINCGDDEDDEDFDPNTIQTRRMINIGDEYQASVDEKCLLSYKSNENDDTMRCGHLVWSPYRLDENDVLNYLKQIQKVQNLSKIKDDELAYTLLNTCNYNTDEAIRQYDTYKRDNDVKVWSEEANDAFEDGYREFGKDFKQIKEKKLSNLSIGQLVSYYYLWKKTERHDVFFNKYKIKKNKHHHLFNPYTTDYMETFMLDNQSQIMSSMTAAAAPSSTASAAVAALTSLPPPSPPQSQPKPINNDRLDDCIHYTDSSNLTNNKNNPASSLTPTPQPPSTTANINPINTNSQLIVN